MAGDDERSHADEERTARPLRPRTVPPRPRRPRPPAPDTRPAAIPPRSAIAGPTGAPRRPESTAQVRIPPIPDPEEPASVPTDRTAPGSPANGSRRLLTVLGVLAALAIFAGLLFVALNREDERAASPDGLPGRSSEPDTPDPTEPVEPEAPEPTVPAGLAEPSDYDGWVDPASFGEPWSSEVLGLLTFRGNPTRSYHGLGPVPENPEILWEIPESGGLCGPSTVGGETRTWCGTGWTGQPSVWEEDGRTLVAFGAYDHNVHLLDAEDGTDVRAPYDFGDIIKGSVTVDPDGFPLIYSGSRADFHILATDREEGLTSLWSMNASNVPEPKWNDDWDSSPLVIDDYLFEGGENAWWYVVKLNRAMGDDGKVTIDPEIVFTARTWDDQLTADLAGSGSRVNDVSVENSLAISGDTVYFANSGGLVQGWDISGLKEGRDPERVFRFWAGDDIDASIVVDDEGMLYVGQEHERASSRARNEEVGQLFKLDPSKPDDPLVWKVMDMDVMPSGVWATPSVVDGVVIAPLNSGRIVGVDRMDGEVLWEKQLLGPTWSSPVIVDDVWIQGDCASEERGGLLRGFDYSDPRVEPEELWSVELEGCIESTPAVFKGRIFVGARGGKFYAIGDPTTGDI